MKQKILQLIAQEIEAIKGIPVDESFEKAIALIHAAVHQGQGKVVAAGIGKAGHIAHNIAMTLSSTGTRAVFIHPTEAQHGDLGILGPQDILLLLSNSGKTREVLELLHLAKNLYPQMKTICITGNKEGELALAADVALWTGGGKEIDRFALVPTTSTTLMTVIGDILVVELMEKIDFTKDQYYRLHHSGYIGQQIRKS
ncbi:MAG TPA: SIS domain-containing protein [Bacteroidia bacterium]|nr:SIS domain-containing protein [Bacteroidia bacterium]